MYSLLALLVSKMAIILSHSHFLNVAFVSIMVFQTFDRFIFGTLTFSGSRWYVLTSQDPQMVRDQKKFGNHWFIAYMCNPRPAALFGEDRVVLFMIMKFKWITVYSSIFCTTHFTIIHHKLLHFYQGFAALEVRIQRTATLFNYLATIDHETNINFRAIWYCYATAQINPAQVTSAQFGQTVLLLKLKIS